MNQAFKAWEDLVGVRTDLLGPKVRGMEHGGVLGLREACGGAGQAGLC